MERITPAFCWSRCRSMQSATAWCAVIALAGAHRSRLPAISLTREIVLGIVSQHQLTFERSSCDAEVNRP